MNEREINDLDNIYTAIEDAWWRCDTPEAEEFFNSLVDQVYARLQKEGKR